MLWNHLHVAANFIDQSWPFTPFEGLEEENVRKFISFLVKKSSRKFLFVFLTSRSNKENIPSKINRSLLILKKKPCQTKSIVAFEPTHTHTHTFK